MPNSLPGIRDDVSLLFKVLIPEGKWKLYMDRLDTQGHPNRREMLALVLLMCQHIEENEKLIADLELRVAELEQLEDGRYSTTTA